MMPRELINFEELSDIKPEKIDYKDVILFEEQIPNKMTVLSIWEYIKEKALECEEVELKLIDQYTIKIIKKK
jgi:hypothetical protein